MDTRRRRRGPADKVELRPNQLSIDLVPNRLSILERQTPGTLRPSHGETARRARPATASRGPRPLPNLSTLIAAAIFAVFILGQVLRALPAGAPPPSASQSPTPAESASGTVLFGTSLGQGCLVRGQASVFPGATNVWWAAHFGAPLDPRQQVVWKVFKAGVVVTQGAGPSKTPAGTWDVMCPDRPLLLGERGLYRLEIRDAQTGTLLAIGTYELLAV